MRFKYTIESDAEACDGDLWYIRSEASLYYMPWRKNNYTLMIGGAYCGLDLDAATGEIMQISGCSPMRLWIECDLKIPPAKNGRVFFQSDIPLTPGVGSDYDRSWNTFYDRKQRFICLGRQPIVPDCAHIQFAPHLIASIQNGQIAAIWAKIQFRD